MKPFDPKLYCEPCGITPQNTNTLVRELLAIRAKRSVNSHKGSVPQPAP